MGLLVSGGTCHQQIERIDYGRAGMHGGKALGNDAKGLRPLGPGSESICNLYGNSIMRTLPRNPETDSPRFKKPVSWKSP